MLRQLEKLKNFKIKSYKFVWLYSAITLILFSAPFFKAIAKANADLYVYLLSIIVAFFALNLIFSLLFTKRTTKVLAILLLIINAAALYFINAYNIFVDSDMMRNVVETDRKEAFGYFNFYLLYYIAVFGVIPSVILVQIQILHDRFFKELLYKFLNITTALLCILAVLVFTYKSTSSFFRNNKILRYKLIPTNYIEGLINLGIKQLKSNTPSGKKKPIADDAMLDKSFYKKQRNKTLLILVVGEAARAQQFSMNGYSRNTNEFLKPYDLINFSNFYSCGTMTAVSVPCIFSHFGKNEFNIYKGREYENLLDVLRTKGFGLLWRDNNSGCKGVCESIPTKNYYNTTTGRYCSAYGCVDEVLLEGLADDITQLASRDIVVVLHQNGSHGPEYFRRVPKRFEKFKPICESSNFGDCSNEAIVNAYDNTIYYTSYFLSQVIELLKTKFNDYNTAMIYVSDHGQSLGEKGLYLHAMPYIIAPKEQTHIPAFMWLSSKFAFDFGINMKCLKSKTASSLSHDNLFHSILGLFRIKTSVYNKDLDLFSGCAE